MMVESFVALRRGGGNWSCKSSSVGSLTSKPMVIRKSMVIHKPNAVCEWSYIKVGYRTKMARDLDSSETEIPI